MSDAQSIDAVLGQIPHGVFLLSAAYEGNQSGVLTMWVQRCSGEPPMVVVAMPKGQPVDPYVRDSRCFALCQVSAEDRLLLRKFATPPERGEDPFVSLPHFTLRTGAPVVHRAMSYMDCELVRHVDLESDHRLFVAQINDARILQPARPAIFFGKDDPTLRNGR